MREHRASTTEPAALGTLGDAGEPQNPGEITQLIHRAAAGAPDALNCLVPLIYGELRKIAHAQIRRAEAADLTTTALVHEAYLRLLGGTELEHRDRRTFFAYAARAMRNLLVDQARSRAAVRHGGDLQRANEEQLHAVALVVNHAELAAVSEAIDRLQAYSPRAAQVVELHVFAGLEFKEIAPMLEINERTAYREWRKAKLLLATLLKDPSDE